jgi:uncharacterized repeat protein (TIGR03803 family)
VVGALTVSRVFAQTLEVLHHFGSSDRPIAPLVLSPDGSFYGTSSGGGSARLGTIFKMMPLGTVTTLIEFTRNDGQIPWSTPLIPDADGNLYGTTVYGGSGHRGTLFRVTPSGVLTTLVQFGETNGGHALGLAMDSVGNLFGTTVHGGNGEGTVFKVAADGAFSTVANIPPNYGSHPAALIIGRDGNLYGRTYNGVSELGTLFRVTMDGTFSALATLPGTSADYSTSLTQGRDGNFYGSAMNGGPNRSGTVFRVTSQGAVTILVTFDWANGALPAGPLTLGEDGNFYGTTIYGGAFEGTVFRMTPEGALTTLANFTDRATGVRPYGGVIFGPDGNLYGTTSIGGSADSGVIFRVNLAADSDGDGVPDAQDQCRDTASNAVVDEHGCSIDQLAPCGGPWRSHGHYLQAVATHVQAFVSEGLFTPEQGEEILAVAVHSNCGKKAYSPK